MDPEREQTGTVCAVASAVTGAVTGAVTVAVTGAVTVAVTGAVTGAVWRVKPALRAGPIPRCDEACTCRLRSRERESEHKGGAGAQRRMREGAEKSNEQRARMVHEQILGELGTG